MRFDFLSKSPLLIGVVYSFKGVFMNTHSKSITVLQYTDHAGGDPSEIFIYPSSYGNISTFLFYRVIRNLNGWRQLALFV